MFTQLAHICIGANDLAASEQFYCGLLGMKKGFEFVKNGQPYGFYAEAGNRTFIEVFVQEAAANLDRPIIKHLCLEVADIDAVIATVRSRGGQITDKKQGCDRSWQAWMTDPSGVSLEIMQYTATSKQFTGEPCEVDW
ncbi:MAG: VOC family protein [Anaerolinea sp.]|nr:VOC family protein [Anaerolinea sp.]